MKQRRFAAILPVVESAVRASLVRSIADAVLQHGGLSANGARARLPDRLAHLHSELTLRTNTDSADVPIADVEALLFELDALSGGKPGAGLEAAGKMLAIRTLQERALVGASHVKRFESCCQALAEGFVGQPLEVRVQVVSDRGFSAELSLGGRPRIARLLHHVATGITEIALRGLTGDARTDSSVSGDRAAVSVTYGEPATPDVVQRRPRRSSATLRAVSGPVSERVNEILRGSSAPQRRRRDT